MRRSAVARRLAAAVLVVAALASCSSSATSSPPAGFSSAVATRSCGPTDAIAVEVFLADATTGNAVPAPPYIAISLWESLEQITQQDWPLTGSAARGAATYHASSTESESATSGSLHITTINADSSITGTVTLDFPVAGHVAGSFHAAWWSRTVTCG